MSRNSNKVKPLQIGYSSTPIVTYCNRKIYTKEEFYNYEQRSVGTLF